MNPLVGVPRRNDGQTNQKKGNQVIRRRKRVQSGTETTQPNVVVNGSWQLSSIASKALNWTPEETRVRVEERSREVEGREGCNKAR